MKTVVVGLSGGVDSSVAAHLMKKAGYNVIGLFMKNWHDTTHTISNECPWLDDSNDAMIVAEQLGIPFQTIDLSKEYKKKIVDYMFAEYKVGRTPNPDILCNKEIKFNVFLDIALSLGADYVATGHYCKKNIIELNSGKKVYSLISGIDKDKDQSYFLCQLSQKQLSKILFPIGDLKKSQVRKIASELKLINANKKDSQGLCFIGKVHLPEFLQQKLATRNGEVVLISSDFHKYQSSSLYAKSKELFLDHISKSFTYKKDDGRVLGSHNGAHFFTIGQRKRLSIGGMKKPLYVISIDTIKNIVYVGEGNDHPGLMRSALFVKRKDVHWVRPDLKINTGDQLKVSARIRYRQNLQSATLLKTSSGLFVEFQKSQFAITPGQFVAWYLKDELLGSGVIS
tara:strand:+ start:40976 stop:42166 length:1191 start_codon:yes stop_codon:yes gene_type:complete